MAYNLNAALATKVNFYFREGSEVRMIWSAYNSQNELLPLPDYDPVWTWHNLYRKDDIFLQSRIGSGFTVMPDGKRLTTTINKNTVRRMQCAHYVRFKDQFDTKAGLINIADYTSTRIDTDSGQLMDNGSYLRIDVVGNIQTEGAGGAMEIDTDVFQQAIADGLYTVTPEGSQPGAGIDTDTFEQSISEGIYQVTPDPES